MIEATAPEAILAYAQLYAYGLPDNERAAGMTEEIVQGVQVKVIGDVLNSFRQYPLSEKNAQAATTEYLTKLRDKMKIRATLKKDDEVNPVVELTAVTPDNETSNKRAETDENLLAFGTRLGKMRVRGLTDEQLKENEDFQQFALECLDKFTDNFAYHPEASIEVVCTAVDGADGKFYWAPVNPEALAKFVTGQV